MPSDDLRGLSERLGDAAQHATLTIDTRCESRKQKHPCQSGLLTSCPCCSHHIWRARSALCHPQISLCTRTNCESDLRQPNHPRCHPHPRTQLLSLSHSDSRTHSLSPSSSHSVAVTLALTLTLTLTRCHLTLTLSPSHPHTHSLSSSRSHSVLVILTLV